MDGSAGIHLCNLPSTLFQTPSFHLAGGPAVSSRQAVQQVNMTDGMGEIHYHVT